MPKNPINIEDPEEKELKRRRKFAANRDANVFSLLVAPTDHKYTHPEFENLKFRSQILNSVPQGQLVDAIKVLRATRVAVIGMKPAEVKKTHEMIEDYHKYITNTAVIKDLIPKSDLDDLWTDLKSLDDRISDYIETGQNWEMITEAFKRLPRWDGTWYMPSDTMVPEFDVEDIDGGETVASDAPTLESILDDVKWAKVIERSVKTWTEKKHGRDSDSYEVYSSIRTKYKMHRKE